MKAASFFRRHRGALLSFFLPILVFSVVSLWDGELASVGADASLYLSIADNALSTGHFIQTVRDIEGFVVPFGLPLILTVFRALGMGDTAIVAVVHLLAGGSCLFLYLAEKNRFGRGGFAPLIYCAAIFRIFLMPSNIYLEYFFLFFVCIILWLLSLKELPLEKKLLWLNIAAFCAYVIRTVMMVVWVPILVYTVVCVIRKRFPLWRALILFSVFLLVIGANTAVNHRETGYWIVSDNYSGEDLYIANNPDTKPERYVRRQFVGEEYYAIRDDETLDQTQMNERFMAAARSWIRENPDTFLKNTLLKFFYLFFRFWFFAPLFSLAGFAMPLRGAESRERKRLWWELAVNIALALFTSVGLIVVRYSLPVWPLMSLHLAALLHTSISWLKERKKENPHA